MFESPEPNIFDQLEDSEQRFRATFEQAAVGMSHVGLDGRWLLVNQKLCDIVGYSHDELLALTFQDITHPDDLALDLANFSELLAGKLTTYTMEKRYIRKDNSHIWVHLTVSLVRDPSGTPKYLISVVEDIDLRKQVEAALRESEQRYRTLVDSLPQIMWINSTSGSIEFFNRHWYEYTGLTEDSTIGQAWLQVIHPDDRAHLVEERTKGIREGKPYRIESRYKNRDGAYCWHVAQVVPLRDEAGNIIAWLGAAAEIDARKRAEEALAFLADASAALANSLDYEATLNMVAKLAIPRIADYCLIDIVDESGQIQRVAAVHRDPEKEYLIQRSRRYAPQPGSGDRLLHVLQTGEPEFVPHVTDEWLQSVAANEEHLRHIRTLEPQSVIIAPMRVRGRSIGLLSLVLVDPHRQYDQTDLKLALDLANRVAQAVDNARLYQAAQTAVRERDALVSIASHELKNALGALSGQAYILQRRTQREETLSERSQRSLSSILEQSNRLHAMLDALLDISRIESGQFTIERHRVDLVSLARQIVEEVEPTLPEDGRHVIALHTPDEPLVVDGDRMRLDQVLRNLLGNAIKYSPAGGRVKVVLECQGDQACVVVRDQGVGISADALPHLFERFYRTNVQRGLTGLGVGLYVVKEIVTQHGGRVVVESEPGHGSTFTIYLPLSAATAATAGTGDLAQL